MKPNEQGYGRLGIGRAMEVNAMIAQAEQGYMKLRTGRGRWRGEADIEGLQEVGCKPSSGPMDGNP